MTVRVEGDNHRALRVAKAKVQCLLPCGQRRCQVGRGMQDQQARQTRGLRHSNRRVIAAVINKHDFGAVQA